MSERPTISTHVLDTEHGRPAQGIPVQLQWFGPTENDVDEPTGGLTDENGRIQNLLEDAPLKAGTYLLTFRVDGPFFEEFSLTFTVEDTSRSYHVPLLLAPYSLTTYRGS